ncbi:hypothetical protein [Hydrogenimonas thermophila]|uniref:Uncharacterized protein n=2 Tax=Hydrogenimonas thermophila TaxID=223786 RepID=A0A1I5QBF5_9BACT|nr:hypothetical protein [Hydrogenimonas thermophila]SFP43639.1 hypothetical protein SAMN05216234_11929 [Hydrogenimonas thermophila]
MLLELMDLEERILENRTVLIKSYPYTEILLSQINTILDFGISSDKIKEWLESNRTVINEIYELLDGKMYESFIN